MSCGQIPLQPQKAGRASIHPGARAGAYTLHLVTGVPWPWSRAPELVCQSLATGCRWCGIYSAACPHLYSHTPDLAPERHFLNTPLIISSLSDLEGQFPPGVVRSTFQISQRSFWLSRSLQLNFNNNSGFQDTLDAFLLLRSHQLVRKDSDPVWVLSTRGEPRRWCPSVTWPGSPREATLSPPPPTFPTWGPRCVGSSVPSRYSCPQVPKPYTLKVLGSLPSPLTKSSGQGHELWVLLSCRERAAFSLSLGWLLFVWLGLMTPNGKKIKDKRNHARFFFNQKLSQRLWNEVWRRATSMQGVIPSFLLSLQRTTACLCDFGDRAWHGDTLLRSPPAKPSHKNDLQRDTQQGVGLALPFAMWPWLISDWSVKIWIIMSTTFSCDN